MKWPSSRRGCAVAFFDGSCKGVSVSRADEVGGGWVGFGVSMKNSATPKQKHLETPKPAYNLQVLGGSPPDQPPGLCFARNKIHGSIWRVRRRHPNSLWVNQGMISRSYSPSCMVMKYIGQMVCYE